MSRKRDSNWSRDEINALLDSMMEITKTKALDMERTNSREIFEYAAKKMGEMGHCNRAEQEKCRTKWKKMKEEFIYARKAREGNTQYKESPGIQPFYNRMEEFILGNFDNISPHSTIVRLSSGISRKKTPSATRTSTRIAAITTNGVPSTSNDNNDTSSTILTRSNTNPEASRLSSGFGGNDVRSTFSTTNLPTSHHQQSQATASSEACRFAAHNGTQDNNITSGNEPLHVQTNEHVDISYRVSTGCRQITIFGDHDVDIKFRGDCVTINKINADYPAAAAPGAAPDT